MVSYVDAVVAVTVRRVLLCVACVYAERVWQDARVTEMLVGGWMRCECGEGRACVWYKWFRYSV